VGYTICWMFALKGDMKVKEDRSGAALPPALGSITNIIRNLAGRYSAVHIP